MDTGTFLRRALGDEGHYCLFAYFGNKLIQKFYPDIETLIQQAQEKDKEGLNAFFSLGTFETDQNRTAANVHQVRSLFIDVDCGELSEEEIAEGKRKYATQAEALSKLKEFCKDTGMPRPTVVNSGYGIHAYWFFTDPVSREEWLPLAKRLKKLSADKDFLIDPSVTADAARILRVPLTHNYKYGTSKPVTILGDFLSEPLPIQQYVDIIGVDFLDGVKEVPKEYNAIQSALIGNYESSFRMILEKTMKGEGCAQIGHIVANQAACSEPLWRAGLSIARHCGDGDVAIHKISYKYPAYSASETETKADAIKGPYRCETFDLERPNVCKDCPNYNKITSPISLGKHIKEATPADNLIMVADITKPSVMQKVQIPDYPKPYFRGVAGGVYVRVPDGEEGVKEELIHHNDLYVVRRIRDVEEGECILLKEHTQKDGIKEFILPVRQATSKEELRKRLSHEGVVGDYQKFMKYITSWILELQSTTPAQDAMRQFGWDKARLSFTVGDKRIYADRTESNPPCANTLGRMNDFKSKGTLEGWKEMAEFYNRDDLVMHQFALCRGFGSVFMEFFEGLASCLFHINGDTGVGKTTVMRAQASIWGDPIKCLALERDTDLSKLNRYQVYHSLPVCMDEMTNTNPESISNFVYQMTQGRERDRMKQSANQNRMIEEFWNLLGTSSANATLSDKLLTNKSDARAEQQRFLEWKAHPVFKESGNKKDTDAFGASVLNNFGTAGPEFITYVLNNMESCIAILKQTQRRIDEAAGLTAQNRYWSADTAATLTGCIIAKRIGLINYDVEKMFQWILELIEYNKDTVEEMKSSVFQIVTEYITENWSSILHIKSTDDLRNHAAASELHGDGLDRLLIEPTKNPTTKLVGRYETDIGRAYLSPKPLRDWCVARQIDFTSLIENLKKNMNGKREKKRLGKGTYLELSSIWVISFDANLSETDD